MHYQIGTTHGDLASIWVTVDNIELPVILKIIDTDLELPVILKIIDTDLELIAIVRKS